jgi:periplasmic mercuric ion binding protein
MKRPTRIRLHPTILILLLILFASCQQQPPKQNDNDRVDHATISASTMICGTCVTTVKKAVSSVAGVTDVHVNLEAKTVEVSYHTGSTSVDAIENAITAAGYDANAKKRDPAAYEKLPECCKKPAGS